MSGKVFSLKKFGFINVSKDNKVQYFLAFLFILGIIFGSFTFMKSENAVIISKYLFNSLLHSKIDVSFWKIFFKSLLNLLLISTVFFILGTSLLGSVSTPILFLLFGLVYGMLLSFSYNSYSVKGIAYSAVILIPPLLFFVFGLLVVSKLYIDFSISMSKTTFNNRSIGTLNSVDFSEIWKKVLLQFGFNVAAALIDGALSCFLIKIFNF